jgi:H+/Cl- antiporter ClcA
MYDIPRHRDHPYVPTLRRVGLSAVAGLLSGTVGSAIVHALDWATSTRVKNHGFVWALPLAGLLIGGLYERFGSRIERGSDLILDEIHRPSRRTPGRMTPLVFFASTLSHLFGASTGREGAAIQMGASLADQLARFLHLSREDRRLVLMAGTAGGFSSALGAPFAGAVFGMEVLTKSVRFKLEYPLECLLSAIVAWHVSNFLRTPHTLYSPYAPPLPTPLFDHLDDVGGLGGVLGFLVAAALVGLATGLAVRVFFLATDGLKSLFRSFFSSAGARGFAGGVVVIAIVWILGTERSLGLGLPEIRRAFESSAPAGLPFEKILLTAVSLASGFKGGEFVPLLFIGSTLGSSVAPLILPATAYTVAFAAACGLACAYGAAARVPLALSIFAAGQFSPAFFPFALVACLSALFTAGRHSTMFTAQKE